MPTMNVSLTPAMISFVEDELMSGEYASACEVVRDALRRPCHIKQVKAISGRDPAGLNH
jgi:putative addiction module CopG family antidote